MQIAYNILVVIALIVATVFGLLVLLTGKGDAMSGGGGSVRTTFKGKASFDDYMSRLTMILGAAFFVLMLLIDGVSNRITNSEGVVTPPAASTNAPASSTTTGSTSAPAPSTTGTPAAPAKH